jgi:hypothetical protein
MATAALAFSLLALAPLCRAQEPAKNTPTPAAKEPFTVPAGELKLPALVDRCAAYLDCNILWLAHELTAAPPVTVREAVSTDRAGCLEFLASSLRSASFTLTWSDQRTGTLEVISSRGPRHRDIAARAEFVSPEQVTASPSLCMPVLVLVPLQHINPIVAINKLRPTLANREPGTQVTIGYVGNMQGLLLAGMRPEVAQAIRVIRDADQPNPDSPTDRGKRIEALEKRIAALEAQLAARPAGSTEKPK